MIPIVTPAEMVAADAAATDPVEVLIGRAGAATARAALDLLGGAYGRRVVVLAGSGNNGNDGRDAAERLRRRGVRVAVIAAADAPDALPTADLVIDAAYGTGFRGSYDAPDPGATPVLAVDIPSGVDGVTGRAEGRALAATRTVTFAAVKPGLLFGEGPLLAGEVEVADIGLPVASTAGLVEREDVAGWLPPRPHAAHKWQSACWVVGGSPGLEGAAALTAGAAMRAGAGYVRWSSPGTVPRTAKPVEVVGTALPEAGWAEVVLADLGRFGAVTVGNGLGLDAGHADELRQLVAGSPIPVIVDADALTLLGGSLVDVARPSTVVTPHDGEMERLTGCRPGDDRIATARALAAGAGCIVLLKGPATVIAEPGGSVLVAASGDQRLATLGTGDVLAGILGALCARGVAPFEAAAAAAHLHGRAGVLGWRHGLVAGDVIDNVPGALLELED